MYGYLRRVYLWLSLLIGCGVLCLAVAAWMWQQRRTWPARAAIPLADPLANINQTGVNVDLLNRPPAEVDDILAQVQAGGFRWVRQRFPWSELEPQRGTMDWAAADMVVTACAAYGLRLIAVLDDAPPWARVPQERDLPVAPPREVSDWGDFVARFATRYRGQIAAYQLWDEPNLAAHWGGRYVSPTAYTRLLREGAVRARDADPGAVVLLAALAPTVENGPLNLNEVAFLRGIVTAGGVPFFDVVALQPYGFAYPPSSSPGQARLDFARPAWVHQEMVRMGLGDRPVWAVAGGWNSPPPGWDGAPGPWPVVSEEEQAQYTLESIRLARREWPWLGPILLYTFRPQLPANDPRWGFALTDLQGESRPVATALGEYNALAHPLPVGDYVATPQLAQYTGDWRFSSAGADPPRNADATRRNAVISFNFAGSALDLTVRRGDFWGLLYISVDGQPAVGLPRDERGLAYLVLYDPDDGVERVNVAHGLSEQNPHHVEIVAHGGWGQWPLVGWRVRRERPLPGGGLLLALGALGAATLAVAIGYAVVVPWPLGALYVRLDLVRRWYRARPEWLTVAMTLGTALAFYLAPGDVLAVPLLGFLFLLFLLRIDLGLATVALATPFYLRPKVLVGHSFSPLELALGLCLAAWLTARLLDLGRESFYKPPEPLIARLGRQLLLWPRSLFRVRLSGALDWGVAALTLVAALSLTWAMRPDVARHEFRTLFLESAVFYALLRLAARSARARRRVREGWLLGALSVALVGLWQLAAGRGLIAAEGTWRVRGLYGSPNNLALYLERAVPMLVAVAWLGERKWRRLAYSIAALPVSLALLATFSKGAMLLGLPVATSFLALGAARPRRRLLWGAVGALTLLGVLLALLALTGRFHALLDWSAGSGFFRLKVWRSALMMIADHPLTGVGADNFLYAYRSRYVLPSAWGELNLSHPHNLLLDAWTRLGIGGVLAVSWLIVSFFRTTRAQLPTARGERRAELIGLVAAMAAALAHGLVDHALFITDLAFVFVLLLALAHRPAR